MFFRASDLTNVKRSIVVAFSFNDTAFAAVSLLLFFSISLNSNFFPFRVTLALMDVRESLVLLGPR